jgi:hypothetical protein
MINLATGDFKLDDYGLIIHPNLTFSQFKAGDILFSPPGPPTNLGYSFCYFTAFMDGLNFEFGIHFKFEEIQRLFLYPPESGYVSRDDLKPQLDDWLSKATKHSPPYEFEWGCIRPAEIDIKGGELSIFVMFRNAILDLGFKDMESYYEYWRTELHYANLRTEKLKNKNPEK